jgi:hypothetical protein
MGKTPAAAAGLNNCEVGFFPMMIKVNNIEIGGVKRYNYIRQSKACFELGGRNESASDQGAHGLLSVGGAAVLPGGDFGCLLR